MSEKSELKKIKKRDGRLLKFDSNKIFDVFVKVLDSEHNGNKNEICLTATDLTKQVVNALENREFVDYPSVEDVQNEVQNALNNAGLLAEAKHFIEYRNERTKQRDYNSELTKTYRQMLSSNAVDMNLMRENANIDGNSVMGTMLRIGSEANKSFIDKYILKPEWTFHHQNGDYHIHDKDFYELTFNCLQVPVGKLLKHGYNTGHGFLRTPGCIKTAFELSAIAIQAEQNDQFGGVGVATFEYDLAPYVAKSFAKYLVDELEGVLRLTHHKSNFMQLKDFVKNRYESHGTVLDKDSIIEIANFIRPLVPKSDDINYIIDRAIEKTENETFQGAEAFIHNMNSLHARAGAQVPFSSINYGTDTTEEGRMVIRSILKATYDGLGHHETPIFPVQIFRMKHGVNFEPNDPNYDLYQLACQVTAKRLFPNFEFQDAPYNLQYYKEGRPETEVATMGCRTRVYSDVNGDDVCPGRGNFSFTTINLPRLGIECKGDWNKFYAKLDSLMDEAKEQLESRFNIIANKHTYNFPFAVQQHCMVGSDDLQLNDTVGEVLKHSSLSIGFIGLAECMVAMTGHHHGEGDEYYQLALNVVKHMRKRTDKYTEDTHMNWSTFATPAEGLSFRFVRIDKKRYGIIPGVTDREYYTNSFHIPVYFNINAGKKIQLEGPFHELCNAGSITYVEMDGNLEKNPVAIQTLVSFADRCKLNYFAINHAVDTCPICGYTGMINEECPVCGFHDGMTEMDEETVKKFAYQAFNEVEDI